MQKPLSMSMPYRNTAENVNNPRLLFVLTSDIRPPGPKGKVDNTKTVHCSVGTGSSLFMQERRKGRNHQSAVLSKHPNTYAMPHKYRTVMKIRFNAHMHMLYIVVNLTPTDRAPAFYAAAFTCPFVCCMLACLPFISELNILLYVLFT
jgi:hypothetical protein